MNKKSALTLGSVGGVLVILIIIIAFVMTGQHKTSSQSSSSKMPKINQAKVMKRIDYETFSMNDDGRYIENVDTNPVVGDRTITGLVYDSVGRPGNMDMVGSFNFFKKHEIENLVTIWHKDGNSFVAKGYFVVKETGAKYPFAFEFNAGYMITQEWYGRDIKI